eukprot:12546-Prymnesium_polylepis.1
MTRSYRHGSVRPRRPVITPEAAMLEFERHVAKARSQSWTGGGGLGLACLDPSESSDLWGD